MTSFQRSFQRLFFFILGHLGSVTIIIMSQGMRGEGKTPFRAKLKKKNLPERQKTFQSSFNFDIISAIILFHSWPFKSNYYYYVLGHAWGR